jgi:hypothetical protein
MYIEDIDVNTLRRVPSHESEPLRSQTVSPRSVGASRPLDTFKVDPAVVGERVQATSKRHTARSSSALGVVVGLIDGRVVVEVFLHMDEVVTQLREFAADLPGIVGLVAGNVVALQDLREAGYVVGQGSEFAIRRRTVSEICRRECDCKESVFHVWETWLARKLVW